MINQQQYWFKVSDYQNKVGIIVDGWYDGLLQVKDVETNTIYISAPNELQDIYSLCESPFTDFDRCPLIKQRDNCLKCKYHYILNE